MASQLYEERKKRLITAAKGKEPDRVPVAGLMETFTLAYAGTTIDEVKSTVVKQVKSYGAIYKDIHFDAAFVSFLSHAMTMSSHLGSDIFFASNDGVTLQHKEYCPMTPEDYDKIIKDPMSFIINDFLPRKYPGFNGTELEIKDKFLNSVVDLGRFGSTMMYGNLYFKNVLKMPVLVGGDLEAPADMFFDFLRGFKPTVTDYRRYPDKVKRATEAIYDYVDNVLEITPMVMSLPTEVKDIPWLVKYGVNTVIRGENPEFPEFPWIFNPMHLPAFLSQKQFDEFYWPTYRRLVEKIAACGGHVMGLAEGAFGKNLDRFCELPAHSMTLIIENDDIKEVKKLLGDRQCIMGGMPLDLLKSGTKDECLAHAKDIIDTCAPGGGFIFSPDKVMVAPNDCKIENLREVNEFVRSYGVY